MIRGEKPSGYFSTSDKDGIKIEGETRQCAHCQFLWDYVPGSGVRRGLCTSCNGLICARQECLDEQKMRVDFYEGKYNCITFDQWNYMNREQHAQVMQHEGGLPETFEVTKQGLIIPK